MNAVRCRDSSVKDMHKSVAIGKVAVLTLVAVRMEVRMQFFEYMHTVTSSQCDVKLL